MTPLMTIDVDQSELLAALEALDDDMAIDIKAIAHDTAQRIAKETSARMRRRSSGPTHGTHTADTMTVEEMRNGTGYIVYAKSPGMPNLPLWLEFGTKYMQGDPALSNAARLEESGHLRRISDAVQRSIDQKGLGSP